MLEQRVIVGERTNDVRAIVEAVREMIGSEPIRAVSRKEKDKDPTPPTSL